MKLQNGNPTSHNHQLAATACLFTVWVRPEKNKESSADTEVKVPYPRFQYVYGPGFGGVGERSSIGVGETPQQACCGRAIGGYFVK